MEHRKSARFKAEARWRWAALILGVMGFGIGCNPGAMSYFLLPWMDDKIPAEVNLTDKVKEPTVVIMVSFANPLETRPEFQTVDRDLAERLAQALKKRFDGNREKIKIIPYFQVKSYLNKDADGNFASKRDIGQHFNADFVINLEVNSMELYEGNHRQLLLFRGTTEIAVAVFDVKKPQGEGPVFDTVYRAQFPKRGPIEAGGGGSSVLQFRGLFLTNVAKELSKYFAPYPHDEKYDLD